METPLIRYNLKDRGRKHTGKPRNFDIRAIADAINSPACQEQVEARTMVGYYGHIPRVRFGMVPPEGAVDGGKYAPVQPAFVTTYLKADYDGNVEHRAEFLDTADGTVASKLWKAKVGGFSSAIDESRPSFFGFDYVNAPNYLGNSFRGIVLDDAFGGEIGVTYDDVMEAEQDEKAQGVILLLDSLERERTLFNDMIEKLTAENEQLLSMLATAKPDAMAALDSAAILPLIVPKERQNRFERDRALFMSAPLSFAVPPVEESGDATYDSTSQRILDRAAR